MTERAYGKMDMRIVAREFLSSAQEALERGEYIRAMSEAVRVIDGVAFFKKSRYAYRNQKHIGELEHFLREAYLVNVKALLVIAQEQLRSHGYTTNVRSTLDTLLHNARGTTLPILKDIQTLQQRLEDGMV